MTTLVLQHFESYWEEGLVRNGTTFHEVNQKVMDFLMHRSDIDKVIITQFEEIEPAEEHRNIILYCEENGIEIEFINYAYGWERDRDIHNDDDFNYTWCYGTREHHDQEIDIIEIEQWQRDLDGEKILLGGAFHGECVLDMQTAFDALEINYETIDELVVGSGIEYQWKGLNPEEISSSFENFVFERSEVINEFYDTYNIRTLEQLIHFEPEFVRELEEEANRLFYDNIDTIKYLDITMPFSDIEEINDIIQFIVSEEMEHEYYYFKTEEPLKKNLFTKISNEMKPKTYYHGTFWDKPFNEEDIYENCFQELKTSESDLDVVYITNSYKTAEWFSSYNSSDPENEIRVIMKIEKNLNKTFEWENGDDRNICLNSQELDIIEDREEVFQHLKNDYDAVIIKNNYPEMEAGDDIACLNDIDSDEIKEIKLFLNNQWTEFLSPDKALDKVKENFLKPKKRNQLKIQ